MKKQLLMVLATAGIGILLGAHPSFAQATDEAVVRVPFQFVAGDAVLPAGRYFVQADSGDPSVLWITSSDGRHAGVVATNWGGGENDGAQVRFEFRKYGDAYLLSAVAMPGEDAREIALAPSVVEHDLVRVARANYASEHHSNG
jgi:hypothetical protein